MVKDFRQIGKHEIDVIDPWYYPFLRQIGKSLSNTASRKKIIKGLPMHNDDFLVSAQFNIMYSGKIRDVCQIDVLLVIARMNDNGSLGSNRYYLKELTDKGTKEMMRNDNE